MLRSVIAHILVLVLTLVTAPALMAAPTPQTEAGDIVSVPEDTTRIARRRGKRTPPPLPTSEGRAPDDIAPDAEALSDAPDEDFDAPAESADPAERGDDEEAGDADAAGEAPPADENRTPLTSREIADQVLPSVVTILAERNGKVRSQGSGFFIAPDLVATNFHVIADMDYAFIGIPGEEDGPAFAGIAALTPDVDLVILKLKGKKFTRPALPLAPAVAHPGDPIFAVGSPRGLDATFSDGMVSSVRGEKKNVIQISAPISAGSSGGPVVNEFGEVAGIVVAKTKEGDNLGFAIGVSELRLLLDNQEKELVAFEDAEDRLDEMFEEQEDKGGTDDDGEGDEDEDDYEEYEEDDEGGLGIGWIIGGICGVGAVCGVCGVCSLCGAPVCLQGIGTIGAAASGAGGAVATGPILPGLAVSAGVVSGALLLVGGGLAGYTALQTNEHGTPTPTTWLAASAAAGALGVGTIGMLAAGTLTGAALLSEEGDTEPAKAKREYAPRAANARTLAH